MKATGVAATVPTKELNLSREFPIAMQQIIAIPIITVLCKLIIQVFNFDSFIFL